MESKRKNEFSEQVVVFLKGMVMGVADVIPGVSGGTLALVLGIYRELIEAIGDLNLRWVQPLFQYLKSWTPEDRKEFRSRFFSMHFGFLIPLILGLFTSFAVGSLFLPSLIANYPEVVRGFFFGLIIASVWVPLRMCDVETRGDVVWAGLVLLVFFTAGFYVTGPQSVVSPSWDWTKHQSGGQKMGEILSKNASALPAHKVFWANENQSLRDRVKSSKPERFSSLKKQHETQSSPGANPEKLKGMSKPYEHLTIPEDTVLQIPRPEYLYVVAAGSIAICAMVLPGISGSYILLILGSYFFLLHVVKGLLKSLSEGMFFPPHLLYLGLFLVGATIGLLIFVRFIRYFLEHWITPTMAGLTGLMVGCLRGVWPFRTTVDGVTQNYLPNSFGKIEMMTVLFMGIGFLIVLLLTFIARENESEP